MKKLKTFGKILLGAGIVGLVYAFYKRGVKELARLEKEEQAENDELESLGASPEKIKREVALDDKYKLVKSLFTATAFNCNVDQDVVDPNLSVASDNVVHVRETSDTKGKRRFLDFLIEIPNYTAEKSNSFPRIADFMRCLKDASDHIWSRIVRFADNPHPKLEGYMLVSYQYPGKERKYELIKVPEYVYSIYKSEKHDGLSKLFEEMMVGNVDSNTELKDVFTKWIYEDEGFDETIDVRPEDMYLMYRISYPIRTENHISGIDLPRAIETLKYMINNMEVYRVEGKETVIYDHLLFHASEDMQTYFTTDKQGHVIEQQVKYRS